MKKSTKLRQETELEKMTRSVLLPNKDGLLVDAFEKEFYGFFGYSFPYEKLGYESRLDLLQSMPRVVGIKRLHSGHILLNAIPDQTTEDIARMVSRQKPNEEGYNRKTTQVVQQEKNRLLKLETLSKHQTDLKTGFYNPSQTLIEDKFRLEVTPIKSRAKLVTENNTRAKLVTEKNTQAKFKVTEEKPETRIKVSKLVSDEEKIKLRAVLAPFPSGLPLSQFSREYQHFYGHELKPSRYDCQSLAEFCSELPEVFAIEREGISGYSGEWVLHAVPATKETLRSSDTISQKQSSSSAKINVPDKVITNVKLILERYPGGIKKKEFLDVYQNLTGAYLNVKPFGIKKIDVFFDRLHDKGVFQMESSILKLCPSPCGPNSKIKTEVDEVKSECPVEENIEDVTGPGCEDSEMMDIMESPAGLTRDRNPMRKTSTERLLELLNNIMKSGDDIQQQSLPADTKIGDFKDVIVAEIFHPLKFWIQLKGGETSEALARLTNEMDNFYDEEMTKTLKVPDSFLVPHLICATLFEGRWHRARVISVKKPHSVRLFYLDYGTVATAEKDAVYFLDKGFSKLPAQAIPARLAGVKPAATKDKFSRETSLRFLELVTEFDGGIGISSIIAGMGQCVDLWLVTNAEKKVTINQILVVEGLASSVVHENDANSDTKEINSCDGVEDEGNREAEPNSDFVSNCSTNETFENIDSSGYDSKKSALTPETLASASRKNRKTTDVVRSILQKKGLSLMQMKKSGEQSPPSKSQLECDSIQKTETAEDGELQAREDEQEEVASIKDEVKSSVEVQQEGGTNTSECARLIQSTCLQTVRTDIGGNVTVVMFDREQIKSLTITLGGAQGEISSFGYTRKIDEGDEQGLKTVVETGSTSKYDLEGEDPCLQTVRINMDGQAVVVKFDNIRTKGFAIRFESMDGKMSSFNYPENKTYCGETNR